MPCPSINLVRPKPFWTDQNCFGHIERQGISVLIYIYCAFNCFSKFIFNFFGFHQGLQSTSDLILSLFSILLVYLQILVNFQTGFQILVSYDGIVWAWYMSTSALMVIIAPLGSICNTYPCDDFVILPHFPASPILNIFSWKFHGLVLGLVGLIDAKGIDFAQPMWPWGWPT